MSTQKQALPNGIAIVVNNEGILQKVIHDSFGLFALKGEESCSFMDCLESDSMPKAYQLIERINTSDMAYGWELHVSDGKDISLFSFSGIRVEDENLLIGAANPDDTEQFLNGLMEMNNESINKLRLFIKDRQQSAGSHEDGWAMYDRLSGLNNELANMQRKLTKKTAQLEHMNNHKNQMLGMAAHDLRNPLTLIQNYSIYLIEDHEEQDIFTDDQFQMVKQIKESSEYMVQIIEDMLDISAIESGSIRLDKNDENVSALIGRVVALSRPSAEKKNITLITKLPVKPIIKEVDAHKFQQVLHNLVSNAIKYSEPDTEVEVGIRGGDENTLNIYVQDSGQGIAKDELEDLFVPFAKISSEPTAGEKSTGLGLAIAQKIIEAHRGNITVESEVGLGSTFIICIP